MRQGPAFVPSGVFKPAFLITLPSNSSGSTTKSSPLFFEEKSVEIYREGQQPSIAPDQSADWVVNVTLALRSSTHVTSPSMTITFPELGITSDSLPLPSVPGGVESTLVSGSFKIPNGKPELWYPHNLGTPQRYNVTVTVHPWDASFTVATGFRTIVLIQSPYTESEVKTLGITPGDNFHFEINGKAFYSSGTNIIPFDPFYARTTTDSVRWVIESAVASGQNMVCKTNAFLLFAHKRSVASYMGRRYLSTFR